MYTTPSLSLGLCSTWLLHLQRYPAFHGPIAVREHLNIFVKELVPIMIPSHADNTWNTDNCYVPTEVNLTLGASMLANSSVSAVEEFWT